MLGRAQQWEQFERLFAKLQNHHKFRVFHTKKFKGSKGDFKGWTVAQKEALYWDLAADYQSRTYRMRGDGTR
jgi:hypothetical protein